MQFCGNLYFNSQYYGFKILSSLLLLQPLGRGFQWKKVSLVTTLFRMVGIQLFCKHKPSVLFYASGFNRFGNDVSTSWNIPCRMLACIVGLHVRAVSVFGKKSVVVYGFLTYYCAVLRFSDPPYAPLTYHWPWETNKRLLHEPSKSNLSHNNQQLIKAAK